MAVFGYFAGFYILLLMLESWFAFRPYIVAQAQKPGGVLTSFYRVLTLGSYDVSEKALAYDRKWIFWLAVTGIPGAHGLHGYVGFVFGSLKSREWWSSDLMPVVFLFSAIISGVSLLIVLYVLSCKLRKTPIDVDCVKGMAYTVWAFIMVTLALEGLMFANLVYKGREGIDMIIQHVTGALLVPYWVLQFGIGAITPLLLLTYMIWRGTKGKALVAGVTVSACLVLLSVFVMRWNVVIGGQELSKTGKGLLYYHLTLLGQEGVLNAILVMAVPFVVLLGVIRLFPPWDDHTNASSRVAS